MKSKKTSKGKPAGKRGVKDLPVSEAKAKNAKGGSFLSPIAGSVFKGTISKSVLGVVPPIPQGSSGSYTQGEIAQDLK